ncbi:MAG: tyrosine-type recombinase/integrase [Chloroflexota bacterium]|nr:tyrosine-type recombinase/integrase [Chloroflexota bacterium]
MANSVPVQILPSSLLPALPDRRTQRPLEDPLLTYLGSLSPRSRVTVTERLKAVARLMQVPHEQVVWHELRAHHMEWIRQALLERDVAPRTVNVTLSALKGISKRARNLNLMSSEEYDRIREVRGASGKRAPVGRSISPGELAALVRACLEDRKAATGARDLAVLAVFASGGIRLSELSGLELADYTAEPHADSWTLKVRGKGNKERMVPITESAAAAVDDWLQLRGSEPGPLFLQVSQTGIIGTKPLSPRGVYDVLGKRLRQAGVAHASPHDFRRTVGGDLLDAGVDIVTVKDLLGHASVETTALYDRRGQRRLREASRKLHFPYARRRT